MDMTVRINRNRVPITIWINKNHRKVWISIGNLSRSTRRGRLWYSIRYLSYSMEMKMVLFLSIISLSVAYLIRWLKLYTLSFRSYNLWKCSFMSKSLSAPSLIFSRYICNYLDADSARKGHIARIHRERTHKRVDGKPTSPENEQQKPNNSIIQPKIPNEHIRLLLNKISIEIETIIIIKNRKE